VRWIRCSIRGNLGSTEQFQHKIDLGAEGADPTLDEADAPAYAESVASAWKAAWLAPTGDATVPASLFPPDVVYTEVGAAQYTQNTPVGADGSGGDVTQDYPQGFYAWTVGARPVGTGGVSLPYEVSCAVTLQTDTRGPRGRGRFYLPPYQFNSLAAGGVFSNTHQTRIGDMVEKFLTQVKSETGHDPLVVSTRAKQLHKVTTANMGFVPDSQRRRRKGQDEARVTVWTAP
jgi:hypothetical protein